MYAWASLVAQTMKILPTMQETRIQSLGHEDLLKKGMATHSSILAWDFKELETTKQLTLSLSSICSVSVLSSRTKIPETYILVTNLVVLSLSCV